VAVMDLAVTVLHVAIVDFFWGRHRLWPSLLWPLWFVAIIRRRHRSAHNDMRHSRQLVHNLLYSPDGSMSYEIGHGVHFAGRRGRRVSDGTILNSDGGFLSIVTIVLSLTIWSQFAIEFLRRSNQAMKGMF